MMRRRALLFGSLVPLVLPPARASAAGLSAVASFSILADMVRHVGGDLVDVTSLVPPDADVHVYQPTAADSRALTAAAMLVENGLGLEGWMARLGEAADFSGVRVVATNGVTPRHDARGRCNLARPARLAEPAQRRDLCPRTSPPG